MNVLFVHDHVFYLYNGNHYTTGSLSAEIIERYLNVFDFITLATRSKKIGFVKDMLKPSDVFNAEFVTVPDYKSIRKIFNYFKARKVIRDEVRKADRVIARTSSLGFLAAKYAKKYNKPLLIEVVGCSWDSLWNHSLLGKAIAPFACIQQKRIVRKSSYVIYVTNQFLQNRYPTNGLMTNCSNVALPKFDENIFQKRLDKINSLSQNQKVLIGTIGAIDVKYKGQQYIIQALGRLKKEGITEFEYQLVGGGSQAFLKNMAVKYNVENQIKFKGYMVHSEVLDWLDHIDIYAQPSRTEGLPRSLIEAMSRGLPCFGSAAGGIPELIDKKFVFSCSRSNINEISSILRLLSKDEMKSQATRNFNESKQYDKDKIEPRRKAFLETFSRNL